MNPTADRQVRERAALALYLGLMHTLLPAGVVLGAPVWVWSEKRRRTLLPRLGFQALPSPPGAARPLWVHALSLGELLSASALLRELHRRLAGHRPLFLSVSTLAAHQVASRDLADAWDRLFYFPYDFLPAVRAALRRVDPALLVMVETDIWPGFMWQVRRRRLPALLVNGRLSPRTFRRFRRSRALFLPALRAFETIHPQSGGEAARYRELGIPAEKLGFAGNLKFDVAAEPVPESTLAELRHRCGWRPGEPVWVAGSTHPGEETAVLEAFLGLRRVHPEWRLAVVPRHPVRGGEVAALFENAGLATHRFSQGPPDSAPEVMVVDVLGVLRPLYHLAAVAFVGGSLVPKGGQNPIEPAAAGVPALLGPDMSDFPDVAAELLEAGAAVRVADAAELRRTLERWAVDPDERARRGHAGAERVARHRGITRRLADAILERLDRAP